MHTGLKVKQYLVKAKSLPLTTRATDVAHADAALRRVE